VPDDAEAIRALIVAYAERLDAGDLDGVAELFAEATFRSARDGRVRTGPEVRRIYDPVVLYDDGTPRTKHVLGNMEIVLGADGEHANASCVFTVLQQVGGGPLGAVLAGRYEDRFERVDGSWRFSERVVHPDLQGDLARHLQAPNPRKSR